MPKLVIVLEVEGDAESVFSAIDNMLDGGTLQDSIAETVEDLYGGEIEFTDSRVFAVDTQTEVSRLAGVLAPALRPLTQDELMATQGFTAPVTVTHGSPPCKLVADDDERPADIDRGNPTGGIL